MKHLKEILKEDIKRAEKMRDAHLLNKNMEAYNFQRGILTALRSTISDINILEKQNN